jgi:ribosomal protein S18 acetylase RimI-like enzyme
MDRIELCSRLLIGLGKRGPKMTPEQVNATLSEWELVEMRGAVIMTKQAEIHVAAIPTARGKWFGREVIRFLQQKINRYGLLETSVMIDNVAGQAFVRRLGFEPVGDSGAAIRYELRKLRHA